MEESPGRAVCPQAAVHPVLNILYSGGEHDRRAEVNGALGTERPTCKGIKAPFSPKHVLWRTLIFRNSRKGKTGIDRYYS